MTMTTFEKEILAELREYTGNRKLKEKDLLEWRTSEIKPRDDTEVLVRLPTSHVWVVYPKPAK